MVVLFSVLVYCHYVTLNSIRHGIVLNMKYRFTEQEMEMPNVMSGWLPLCAFVTFCIFLLPTV